MKTCFVFLAGFLCLFSSCARKSQLKDFIGDHNTAYSQALKGVEGKRFNRIYFNDLMPIKIKVFQEAQTDLIKGQMRLTYNNYINIIAQLKQERIYDMRDFQVKGDTLEFSFGPSRMVGQIINGSTGRILGLEKRFMNASDVPSLQSNPLYINEKNRILYFKVIVPFDEGKLLEDCYNAQISEWQIKLKDSESKNVAQSHITFLTKKLELTRALYR